jgi:hypothetical protein
MGRGNFGRVVKIECNDSIASALALVNRRWSFRKAKASAGMVKTTKEIKDYENERTKLQQSG